MIDAHYFDGRCTRRHPVTMVIAQRVVSIRGEGVRRSARLSQLRVSERLEHAPRILRFADGGFIEAAGAHLESMLRENRYVEPRVVRWQNNWPLSLLALVSLLALLVALYQWGLPWAGDRLARHVPRSLEQAIGEQALRAMDGDSMEPSRLLPAEQARLRALFGGLAQPRGEHTDYRLEFRHSHIGPNAFALPNGVIVMTDQLVRAAEDERAVLGVLGHELGHLQLRHTLRGLVQEVGVGGLLYLWVGDVSSALAALPAALLDQSYSRDFERDADQYAIDMLRANGLPLAPMAALFEKMHDGAGRAGRRTPDADADGGEDIGAEAPPAQAGADDEDAPDDAPERALPPDYFSSHPSDAERIARLRAADRP